MFKKILSVSLIALAISGTVVAEDTASDENAKKEYQLPEAIKQKIMTQMVKIEGGEFMMGTDAPDARDIEKPAHKVILDDFYIGKYEITQDIYYAVMGVDYSFFRGDNMPVDTVSSLEIKRFIGRLNKLTGKTFRMPTEAEWEFAARGGKQSKGYLYSGSNDINAVAWFSGNSKNKTHQVGTKQANELGLYDMSGNVIEWVADGANRNYYKLSPVKNPYNDKSDDRSYDMRIMRGGSYEYDARESTIFFRDGSSSNSKVTGTGFRLAMTTMENTPPAPKNETTQAQVK